MQGTTVRIGRLAGAAAVLALTTAAVWAAAGNLDATYGTSGVAVSTGQAGAARAVATQGDGKALLGGARATGQTTSTGAVQRWRIERFDAAGAADTSYGSAGAVSLFGYEAGEELCDLRVDGAGRCVAAGSSNVAKGKGYARVATVVRLSASGALDTSFGSGGVVRLSVPNAQESSVRAIALLANGSVVVAGHATISSRGTTAVYPFVARLTSSGVPDSAFGSSGITLDQRNAATVRSVGVQSTGAVVVGGNRTSSDTYVVRFLSNGSADTTFGVVASTSEQLRGLAVDASDRIVVSGNAPKSGGAGATDGVAVRYLASGARDTGFGSGGRTVLSSYETQSLETDPVFTSAGIVIAMGADRTTDGVLNADSTAAVRLLDAGGLDTGFGSGGVGDWVSLAGSSGLTWPVLSHGVAPTSGGAVIVGGRAQSASVSQRWFLARTLGD
jgi:uncharacterized delta-60 repeat protein